MTYHMYLVDFILSDAVGKKNFYAIKLMLYNNGSQKIPCVIGTIKKIQKCEIYRTGFPLNCSNKSSWKQTSRQSLLVLKNIAIKWSFTVVTMVAHDVYWENMVWWWFLWTVKNDQKSQNWALYFQKGDQMFIKYLKSLVIIKP